MVCEFKPRPQAAAVVLQQSCNANNTVNSEPIMAHITFSSEQYNKIFRELNCLQKLAEDVV